MTDADKTADTNQYIKNTISYLQAKFSEYYSNADLYYPERFTRREWGFMFLGESYMQRHIRFRNQEEVRAFLTGEIVGTAIFPDSNSRVPAHVYYSTAYYSET